jgi:hypothetical protein
MWITVGASVPGTRHIRAGIPCQDAYGYRLIHNDLVIASVADGLGSAPRSADGSKVAVKAALESLQASIIHQQLPGFAAWTQIMKHAFANARSALEETARIHSVTLREYATTLIVVAVTQSWIVTGHIGDGSVVVFNQEKTILNVSPPERGEYLNETIPLTAPQALASVRYTTYATSIEAVALLTDGLENLSINTMTNKPYEPFFLPLFLALPHVQDSETVSQQLAAFLASPRVCARTDDDTTLLLIGRQRDAGHLQD